MTEHVSPLSAEIFRQDLQRLGLDIPEEFFNGALTCTHEIRNAVALLYMHKCLNEEPACGFDVIATLAKYRADHE
ncbi:hypothetical protein [Pectobacterium punjabense]|uniref:hypothetical protein n=1 Tax=Pectobacterium punjabense TaxID=2108399 RepID=UPI00240520C8|nr:hypothetical protein [Pectobacterium punjabense]MDG0796070.1 hypothetical protein [Pectobacterium punjabense]